MQADPLWVNVSELMQEGNAGLGRHITRLGQLAEFADMQGEFIGRLNNVLGIRDIDLHVEEVTGADKTVDVVVDIFNRVNSSGTKLSQGDLALAKICGSWPEGREHMQSTLERWRASGYDFDLDWLLRNVNGIVTGEARFTHLHDVPTAAVQDGLARTERYVDYALNLIGGRLGLDHDRVLFGRYALPVMSRYIDQRGGHLTDVTEQDRLLYWYFQSAMWGRFSGSTETVLDQDFEAIEDIDRGIEQLIERLRLWHGSLEVEPAHFRGWSLGARFYPVLYALTRVGDAKDWGTGLALKSSLLGRMNALEVHHIFPKALLYDAGLERSEVNAVANFCFLTKDTNLQISARPPAEYFQEIEARQPGALASQWIPMDRELWDRELLAVPRGAPAPACGGSKHSAERPAPRRGCDRASRCDGTPHASACGSPGWHRGCRGRGCAQSPERLGTGAWTPRGADRARARARRDRRPSRHPRPGVAKRSPGGLQQPRGAAARRRAENPPDRERPWIPPLHESRGF